MSVPGGCSLPGPQRRVSIRAACRSQALEIYRLLGKEKGPASLKQIRAALSFAYKHWDLKNPFAKIEPPLHKEPQIRYLLLADIRRLLDYLNPGGMATALPSRSTWPTPSSRQPAGLMS